MARDVKAFVRRCHACDRTRSRLGEVKQALQSLPLVAVGMRWSLDFAGNLPVSGRGNRYILVMIDHASKWVEAVATPTKSSEAVARAVLERVVARFGGCHTVLTDQGREFRGEFEEMLNSLGVQHRQSSRYSPQTNGLAEKMVSTVKEALRKYAELYSALDWDLHLPWLLMGYRFSTQHALGVVSPYELLHGKKAVLPLRGGTPSVGWSTPIMGALDDHAAWAATLRERARLYELMLPAATEHLQAAQDRDQRRHASRTTDSGGNPWQAAPYKEGDFVYIRSPAHNTLETDKAHTLLQVRRVRQAGGLELQGKDRHLRIVEHTRNVALCHLPNVARLPQYLQRRRARSRQGGGVQQGNAAGAVGVDARTPTAPQTPQGEGAARPGVALPRGQGAPASHVAGQGGRNHFAQLLASQLHHGAPA
jgi:transposase InsO family protein